MMNSKDFELIKEVLKGSKPKTMKKQLSSKEALNELKRNYDKNINVDELLSIIETDINLLEALKKKLDRKVEIKEYHHEESNTYRLSTLLTYEIKEKWEEKEIECLRQFLLNLSGIQTDLYRLEEYERFYERVKKILPLEIHDTDDLERYFRASEQDREVLRIIKEKKVEVNVLMASDTLDCYNDMIFDEERLLTQEEYDLLKGYLSDGK